MVLDIFEQINRGVLKRNEQGVYTIEGESIDELSKRKGKNIDDVLGLSQKRAAFTPSKFAIESFAATTYLYGVLGFKPENFTSVPVGYVATYRKDNETNTVIIFSNSVDYQRELIAREAKKKLQTENLHPNEKAFLTELVNKLNSGISLMEISYMVSCAIDDVNEPWANQTKQNATDAILAFNEVNQNNCHVNHIVLHSACLKVLGYNAQTATEEQNMEAQALADQILNGWILPAYLEYVGHDRDGFILDRKPQIVSDNQRVIEAFEKMQSKGGAAAVLTMSSTDYSADVVYEVLNLIQNKEVKIYYESRPQELEGKTGVKAKTVIQPVVGFDGFNEALDYIAPKTPANSYKNKKAKELLDSLAQQSGPHNG